MDCLFWVLHGMPPVDDAQRPRTTVIVREGASPWGGRQASASRCTEDAADARASPCPHSPSIRVGSPRCAVSQRGGEENGERRVAAVGVADRRRSVPASRSRAGVTARAVSLAHPARSTTALPAVASKTGSCLAACRDSSAAVTGGVQALLGSQMRQGRLCRQTVAASVRHPPTRRQC